METYLALHYDLPYPALHRALQALVVLSFIAAFVLTSWLASRHRLGTRIALVALGGYLVLRSSGGPYRGMEDSPAEAARLRLTLRHPRQLGPFLFPAGTTLQYWAEDRDNRDIADLDSVDLPGPTQLAGLPLTGHLQFFHAVSGVTATLAADAPVSGLPCRQGLVLLYPETARLLSCTLQQPQPVQGWPCSDVELSPEGDLRSCRTATPTQLPVGRFPAGIGLTLFHGAVERLGLNRGQQITLLAPPLHWTAGSRMEISLASPATVARIATLRDEALAFRGVFLHGLIEWVYPPPVSTTQLPQPAALKAALDRPLTCQDGTLTPGTLVLVPAVGELVTSMGPEDPDPGAQAIPAQHTCLLEVPGRAESSDASNSPASLH